MGYPTDQDLERAHERRQPPRPTSAHSAAPTEVSQPIPMLLWCPFCGQRHIDRFEFATRVHHTHACQHCGGVWRPAVVPTVGVQFLPGFKDPSDNEQVKSLLRDAEQALGEVTAALGSVESKLGPKPKRKVVVSTRAPDGIKLGLYEDEVCPVGTCHRPPGHSGSHDQFGGPRAADAVPFHPVEE